MPALFAYLIAVALLLGGGYGALSWLATPEPVRLVGKAKQPAAPPLTYAEDTGPGRAQATPPQASRPEAGKPEVTSKPEVTGTDRIRKASSEVASSDQPLSPQPQQPAAASGEQAKVEDPGPAQQQERSARAEMPEVAADHEARQDAEAPAPEANQDNSAPAKQAELARAVSPGNAGSVASIAPAPAAKTAKRPNLRQTSRRSEKRPLEMMTLRTIELPDGRRMTQLIPYRSGDRYRDDGPAMAFGPDE